MNTSKPELLRLLPSIIAMALVILISNILVQIPVDHVIYLAGRSIDLAELLTWGAFSYPVAFLGRILVTVTFCRHAEKS